MAGAVNPVKGAVTGLNKAFRLRAPKAEGRRGTDRRADASRGRRGRECFMVGGWLGGWRWRL
jgi:hypothetical protein